MSDLQICNGSIRSGDIEVRYEIIIHTGDR